MSKIVVVMTCHNRREKTTGCLVKLHDGNNNNEYHYIVVDAGSTDGTGGLRFRCLTLRQSVCRC